MTSFSSWTPQSWRYLPVRQQPIYEDQQALAGILSDISDLPPIVGLDEVMGLRQQLTQAAHGRCFVLQGGDCAERFVDCTPEAIARKLQLMQKMAEIVETEGRLPLLRIGRIAGQYAKPRSAAVELQNGVEIPCFRGDNIHSFNATIEARRPDPERLRLCYHFSALTRSYVARWMRQHGGGALVFTSHEGLLLNYEAAMTRWDDEYQAFYNCGAHMLWVGDRTRATGEAHVEYFRGIANPIGVKISAETAPEELVLLARLLNPDNVLGRLVFITRLGCDDVQRTLPPLISAIQTAELNVVWLVDPMHGNLVKTKDNIKTRNFDHIVMELRQTFAIHQGMKSILAGVHLEMTGDDVTECVGGRDGISPEDLLRTYQTYCDPRLNRSQAIDIAHVVAQLLIEYPRKMLSVPVKSGEKTLSSLTHDSTNSWS